MKRLTALFLILALLLTGCGGPAVSSVPQGNERTFVDDCGRTVEVPEEISRIVPSGPLAQIVLFAIAPDMFVGLASHWADSARGIIGEEYLELPYFGQLYGSADLNVEELALANPQVIIDVGEPKDAAAEELDTLQSQTNIPTVYISATLESMPDTFRRLGELLGRPERGEELAAFCQRVYDRTLSIMETVGEDKVDALYVLGEEGLNVLARGSYHAELIDLLTNNLAVVADPSSRGLGNEVGLEQIAFWDPEFILFAYGSVYDEVAYHPTWSQLSAIGSGSYVEVPEGPHNWMGAPPSVQRYLGLIWLTAVLYPEYCDYDVKADVLEYYHLFYGCDLSDAQYEDLTANAFRG